MSYFNRPAKLATHSNRMIGSYCLASVWFSSQPRAALHKASIGKDRSCGDIAGAAAGKQGNHTSDFLRLRHASERYGGVELGHLGGTVHLYQVDGSRHGSWAHAYHQDVMVGQFDAGGAREHRHAAFGKAISSIAGHGPIFVHGRDINDTAAATLLDHLFGRKLCSEKSTLQVDLEHLLVLLFGRIEYGRTRLD